MSRGNGLRLRHASPLFVCGCAFACLRSTRSGSPAAASSAWLRRPGARPDAHGGAHHRRRDGGARRRHRAAADRGAGAAGDRCRRRARHVAAGDCRAGGVARPRPRQVDRVWPSAARAPTATAACRRMPSAMEGDRRRWVQGHLLEQGLARAYAQAGNRACAAEALEAERVAREARRGLWAEAAYQVRPADSPSRAVALSRARFRWSRAGSRASARCAARST